ncbi:Uncharacterized protein Fot_51858 [Forsythia ovata]|uniref:Uncharacterized protein n=1 Tax=Forsythia ovata TaxID=205694 RepID=A0ABD1PWL9_9LAMI
MGEDYKLIAVITPNTTNWTAKVVVLEKISARTSYLSPTKYQNVVLMDMEGSQSQQNLIAHSASMPQLNKLLNFTTDHRHELNCGPPTRDYNPSGTTINNDETLQVIKSIKAAIN